MLQCDEADRRDAENCNPGYSNLLVACRIQNRPYDLTRLWTKEKGGFKSSVISSERFLEVHCDSYLQNPKLLRQSIAANVARVSEESVHNPWALLTYSCTIELKL